MLYSTPATQQKNHGVQTTKVPVTRYPGTTKRYYYHVHTGCLFLVTWCCASWFSHGVTWRLNWWCQKLKWSVFVEWFIYTGIYLAAPRFPVFRLRCGTRYHTGTWFETSKTSVYIRTVPLDTTGCTWFKGVYRYVDTGINTTPYQVTGWIPVPGTWFLTYLTSSDSKYRYAPLVVLDVCRFYWNG